MEHMATSLTIIEKIQRRSSLRASCCNDRSSSICRRADEHVTLWQESVRSACAGQSARCRFMERCAIESCEFAHVMEAVGAGARRHGNGVGPFHELGAGRPKLLETKIAMQAHAAND